MQAPENGTGEESDEARGRRKTPVLVVVSRQCKGVYCAAEDRRSCVTCAGDIQNLAVAILSTDVLSHVS